MTLVVAGYPGTVDKIKFSRLLDFSMYSGIDGLELTPSGSNRGIEVGFDHAAVPGVIVEQTAPMVVSADANDSSFNRRDRIILRHDWGNNQSTLAIKKGTPAASPSWPSTVRNPGVLWEQSIGRITVGPGMGAIPPENIIASGIPRQSPLVILDDETGLPFVAERVTVIDPATGRLRFSDGSSYQGLRVRQSDTDVAVLKKTGSGAGTLSVGATGFYSNSSAVITRQAPPGMDWSTGTGSGLHTAQWRHPAPGVYLAMASTRYGRTNAAQSATVDFHMRSGMSASTAASGSVVASSRRGYRAETMPNNDVLNILDVYRVTSTTSIYGFTMSNLSSSSHAIDREDSGTGTHYEIVRLNSL